MKLDLKARAQNRTRRATKRAETLANKSRGSGSEAEEAVAMGFEQSHSPVTTHSLVLILQQQEVPTDT